MGNNQFANNINNNNNFGPGPQQVNYSTPSNPSNFSAGNPSQFGYSSVQPQQLYNIPINNNFVNFINSLPIGGFNPLSISGFGPPTFYAVGNPSFKNNSFVSFFFILCILFL
jgi:hypothetical protein